MIEVTLTPQRIHAGQDADLTVTLTNVGQGTCRNVVFRLSLPRQITRLSGDGLIEVPRLPSGESATGSLRVRAGDTGTWPVGSSNFSYKDRRGTPVRSDYAAELTVTPFVRVEVQPPRFTIDLIDKVLPHREWGALRVRLTNSGDTVAEDIDLSVRGPFSVDSGGLPEKVPTLAPAESAEFSFPVKANESGAVPVHLDLTCLDGQQMKHHRQWRMNVSVGKSPVAGQGGMTILYLSANPRQTEQLRVEAEAREIREELRKGVTPDIRIENRGATRARDISDALLNIRPRIVHFSGHGAADGRLYLERDGGHAHLVSPEALAALFREASDYVKCVIVNACQTQTLAKAISDHIDYVIAMKDVVPDKAAIAFSIGFYQALAAGLEVAQAYRFGRTQIHLQLGNDFADLPVLYSRLESSDA
jgi:hypothetical protein